VALERALIHQPALVLLDEPFTGLDDASAGALVQRLRSLKSAGAIVVVATHDLDLAEGLLDHAVFLRDGRMAESVARPQGLRSTYRAVMAQAPR
jgi:ABC-type multidrug transport system ATPase subunit